MRLRSLNVDTMNYDAGEILMYHEFELHCSVLDGINRVSPLVS